MLLQLLGQDLCRRVNSHLEQALILLDLVLTHAKVGLPSHRHNDRALCLCGSSVLVCNFEEALYQASRRLELPMRWLLSGCPAGPRVQGQ